MPFQVKVHEFVIAFENILRKMYSFHYFQLKTHLTYEVLVLECLILIN